ncbi:unnamed protein product [Schistosoma margrebowiei]|uniref:Uncharacterized protein n=1 Tax=Schistosoma margrebowiei TaxID=48269 RepID=A0A183M8R9_9TREM|nr:unnamed protein product [Schistosoma margrebowiei]
MPTNCRRKSNSKFVDVNEESSITKQVPFDVLKCHGSDSNRVDYHGSDSSLNSMADDVKNLSLKEKKRLELTGKSVLPITPVVGLELPKVELSYFDGQARGYWKFIRHFETYVVSRVTDDSQRLLYLMHYCKGKAKAAEDDTGIQCLTTLLPVTPSNILCSHREKSKDRVEEIGRVYLAITNISEFSDLIWLAIAIDVEYSVTTRDLVRMHDRAPSAR